MPQTILSAGLLLLVSTTTTMVAAFSVQQQSVLQSTRTSNSALSMISVGLGPKENDATNTAEPELVPGVDYEVPDHEAYRTSRRTKLDEECDAWYKTLLGEDDSTNGFLGTLAQEMRERVLTPVELKNEVCQSMESRSLSLSLCVSSFHFLFNSMHTQTCTPSHTYCIVFAFLHNTPIHTDCPPDGPPGLHTIRQHQVALDTVGACLWIGRVWNPRSTTKRRDLAPIRCGRYGADRLLWFGGRDRYVHLSLSLSLCIDWPLKILVKENAFF